ncbi:ATP-binding protein [uncultured Oscillibacter sp.]|uniref:ATP-binding protein n=1 Tax=uncultured Oscillibacter sp. TaxID=876091 RepID=UPI0025DD82A9|nr:ATP-binding protein [uncultured Oscillibacter sp.]
MIKRLRARFIRIATLSVAVVMLLLTVAVNAANFISTDSDLTETLELICGNEGTIPLPAQGTATGASEEDAAPNSSGAADGSGTSGGETSPDGSGSAAPSLEEAPPDAGSAPGGAPPDDAGAPRPVPAGQRRGGPFTAETPFSTRFFVLRYDDGGTLVQADLDRIASVTQDDTDEFLAAALAHGEGDGYYGSYKFRVVRTGEDRRMAVFLDCYQELRAVRAVAVWSLLADGACIALVYLLVVLCSRRAIDPVVRSAERQKQFITDAGHELKTPITVIATSLKVLEMEVGRQKWIDKAQAQTEKLGALVNSLVTLSRMDEEEPPLTFSNFDMSAAVLETAESFRDSAETAGHPLALDVPSGLTVRGDEAAIRQLVSILLDNALKYALPGGTVSLSLRRERHGIVLCSSNPCAPMDPTDLPRLFDRFYRPDKSRSSATGGFGVGLSIAQSVAQAHGGSIRAECPAEGTIVFTVTLKS